MIFGWNTPIALYDALFVQAYFVAKPTYHDDQQKVFRKDQGQKYTESVGPAYQERAPGDQQ